jgi:uncharacterized MAPEG superfamily protein
MTLATIVLLVMLLFVVQLFLQETSLYHFNLWQIMGNRDTKPEESIIAARLCRAKNNMLEALPLFLGLAMLALFKGDNTGQATNGATLFLIARTLYVPIYAAGIPVLRSLIWLAGMTGLAMMAEPFI